MSGFPPPLAAAPLQAQAPWQSGRYYFCPNITITSTATRGNTTMFGQPFYVPNAVTISRIGAEVTVIGDVGSKVRLGIYADDGTGRPGALVIDAGTIAGDSVAVQEIVISQALGPGTFWAAAVVQIAPGTAPTLRINNAGAVLGLDNGASTPAAGAAPGAYTAVAAVAGALPTPFGTVALANTSAPRVFVKVA